MHQPTTSSPGAMVAGPDALGRRLRICVFGASLDVGNQGVRALGVSTARLFRQAAPQSHIVFHYGNATGGTRQLQGDPPLEIEIQHCRLSPRSTASRHILYMLALAILYRAGIRRPAARNEWLASLLSADLICEIRGGDSFSDIYGFRRFLEGCLPLLSVILLGRPYTMLPQTYGPFASPVSRALARAILKRAETLLTRDRHCIAEVERLCDRTPAFCPDVAFTLEPVPPSRLPISPASPLGRPFVVGVNVSGLLYMGGYTGKNMFGLRADYPSLVDRLLEVLLTETDAEVMLVPHEFGAEFELETVAALRKRFGEAFPGRVAGITEPMDESGLKWVIGQLDFFVGSRMHACIAALSQGVPAIGLAYSSKFQGVFESVGLEDAVIDLRATSLDDAIDRTRNALERREAFELTLKSRTDAAKRAVYGTFATLISSTTSHAAIDPRV